MRKAFKYVKRMLPFFRAVVRFCSISILFKLYILEIPKSSNYVEGVREGKAC